MKKFVVMNEQHSLLPEQEAMLKENFGHYSLYSVPSNGWSTEEMEEATEELLGSTVIFVSPVPYLLARLAFWQGYGKAGLQMEIGLKGEGTEVYLFHNSNREKKELPNGKVISVISKTGWELIPL